MNMGASSIITLTTDFGYKDPFVAEIKGVILSAAPFANIVDITHDIEPFDIMGAAFVIGSSSAYFPSGTVHLVVVDPGVGSNRRAIIVKTPNEFYVGPDNGVFSEIIRKERQVSCFNITNETLMISKDSPTFQGRDVFAPVSAWLLKGGQPGEAGPEISDPTILRLPKPQLTAESLFGEVVYTDRFGNAITNITSKDLQPFGSNYEAQLQAHRLVPVNHYAQLPAGKPGCLVNSSGFFEIFVFRNSAAALLGIKKGDTVRVLPGTGV